MGPARSTFVCPTGYNLFFELVPPLANCADIPTRPQVVAQEDCQSTHVKNSRAGKEN